MKAIILSAGRGLRMLPMTKNTPKCLLEIGNGVSVLESQLTELMQCSEISKVVLVLGYLANQVEAKLEVFREQMDIEIVYNPFFDSSNNLISLWTAAHEMTSDFIIINGDNIFNQKLLETIVTDQREGVFVVIDKKRSYDDDDMKVSLENGRVLHVSKEISEELTHAESVGFHKVAGKRHINMFVKILLEAIREPRARDQFYLALFNRLIENGALVEYIKVNRSDWAEIDFHPDL